MQKKVTSNQKVRNHCAVSLRRPNRELASVGWVEVVACQSKLIRNSICQANSRLYFMRGTIVDVGNAGFVFVVFFAPTVFAEQGSILRFAVRVYTT
jgi:hypothetical protein